MEPNSEKTTVGIDSNLIENNHVPAEMRVEMETLDYIREPPPPYTVSALVESQPQPVPQPSDQQTVVIQQPLKNHPVIYTCGACGETVLTKVQYVNTRQAHMCAGFICGCTLWCMLCCLSAIPYLLPMCKRAKHHCPNCNHFIGDYSTF